MKNHLPVPQVNVILSIIIIKFTLSVKGNEISTHNNASQLLRIFLPSFQTLFSEIRTATNTVA